MCMPLKELMYAMNVQVPREAEDTGSPGGSPDISSCETPDIATRNRTWISGRTVSGSIFPVPLPHFKDSFIM